MMVAMLIVGIGCLLAGVLAIVFGIPGSGVQFWQYPDPDRRYRGMHRADHPWSVGGCARIEEYRAPDGPWPSAGPGGSRAATSRCDAADAGEAVACSIALSLLKWRTMPNRMRSHRRRRHGVRKPRRAIACDRMRRSPSRLHPSPRLAAICCFPRRHAGSASAPRRGRPIPLRPNSFPEGSRAPSAAESGEAVPATFDDAWPRSERSRPADAPPRRGSRAPTSFSEPPAAAADVDHYAPADHDEPPPVTVLKSGVVDGMAYSLYSDGSIEAQMPEGMMRFTSIDELRSHLDQRP